MRLVPELVLGIGGVRALRALGIDPAVWHLNEGHSAFLLVERARELLLGDSSLAATEALRRVGRDAVFTIHTPVPAGNEVFERELVTPALQRWLSAPRGMEPDELLELGRGPTDEPNAPFDMTAFVLRHASNANAVSQLHGTPPPRPGRSLPGTPSRSITNGVHVPTWLGRPVRRGHSPGDPEFRLETDPNGPERLADLDARSTTRSCGAPTSSRSARWSASSRASWRRPSSRATGSRRPPCARSAASSIRMRSSSASLGASRRTSAPTCCSATRSALGGSCRPPSARCRS